MGFSDLVSDAGLATLNSWLTTRSYVVGLVQLSFLSLTVLSHILNFCYKMRIIWSVFKRRLKTPPNDYFQSRNVAHLNCITLTILETLETEYVWLNCTLTSHSHGPSQADATTFNAVKQSPNPAKYPHVYRWHKHIASYEADFSALPGDPSKAYTTYGPESKEVTVNPKAAPDAAEEEDDMDLFGSESEEEDAEVVAEREKRLADYKKKKEGKAKPAAKSIVTMDVKPWDDETDMDQLQKNVKAIEMDGLVWGASKLVPVGFGIKKLQINVVVEDEKVSLEDLQEKIAEDEDHVQSSDIVAMQKL